MNSRSFGFFLAHALAICPFLAPAHAGDLTIQFDLPSMDRWMYPFNSSPGYRDSASVFGSLGQEDAFPPLSFDQRDAQFLLGFDLRNRLPLGRGSCGYRVLSATVTLTVSTDGAFSYDPTYDTYTTYPAADTDQGRPVELYGAAFRNGWQACPLDGTTTNTQFPCYWEGTPTQPGPPFGPSISKDVRHVYPTDFQGRITRDISNNVRDMFDPDPFAVGQIAGLTPGALVPVDRQMTFALDVADPDAQAFLRASLDTGQLRLVFASLQSATAGGGGGPGTGSFATFYCKEIGFDPFAPKLSMTVRLTPPGDANADGAVSFPDITAVLTNWTSTGPDGDANCDGVVSFPDITEVLTNWGAMAP